MPSPYAPQESADQLWFEQSVNAATYIGAIAFGLHAAIFYRCVRSFALDKKEHWKWIPFVSALFALGTINICASINFNQAAWIDERNYPGGPLGFLVGQPSKASNLTAIATSVIIVVLADAFLIYRCHVLWRKPIATLFLSLALVASAVLSALHCVQAARPAADLYDEDTLRFSIPYASLSMSLNILLSLSLLWRVFDLRRRLSPGMSGETRMKYAGFEAVIVESAFPFGLVSFIFVVLYGIHSIGAHLFVSLLVQLEGIVPELIVLRILNGHAWSMDAIRKVGPRNVVLRGDAGRSEVAGDRDTDNVSMVTLNDRSANPIDAKVSHTV